MTVTVYHRSTAIDVRTGRPFRWQHNLEAVEATRYRDAVNAGKLDGATVKVVAWLEGEAEPAQPCTAYRDMRLCSGFLNQTGHLDPNAHLHTHARIMYRVCRW